VAATNSRRGLSSSGETALAVVLALLVDERERQVKEDKDARKTEVVLAGAGLGAADIAALTGKNVDAVRKTLQRARS
jgi:DNA-directed RNA polymerase specialized sigma24 family protein